MAIVTPILTPVNPPGPTSTTIPDTLAPRGYHTYDGKLSGPMTAHPKLDPVSGEMVFFGYSARGPMTPDLMMHVADRDGRLIRSVHLLAPFPSMVHDFVVTRTHVIFPIFPLTGSSVQGCWLQQSALVLQSAPSAEQL